MNSFREALHMLRVNWKTLAGFEILYRLLSFSVFLPLFSRIVTAVMEQTGYPYLTTENMWKFLSMPEVIVVLALVVLLIAVYSLIDIGVVIYILDLSDQDKRADVLHATRFALRNALRAFRPWNLPMLVIVLCLVPFLNLGVYTGILSTFSVTDVALRYLRMSDYGMEELAVFGVLMLLVLFFCFYTFHYFFLEHMSFPKAARSSIRLGRNHHISNFFVMLRTQLLCYLLVLGTLAMLGLALLLSQRAPLMPGVLRSVSTSVLRAMLAAVMFLVSAFAAPISYTCVGVEYYQRKVQRQESMKRIPSPVSIAKPRQLALVRMTEMLLVVLTVGLGIRYVSGLSIGRYWILAENLNPTEISAHRGASAYYPENTMAAFQGAVEQGADWIELDVQQSFDRALFVMHDKNFRRTTGVDKYAYQLIWDQIREMDAGSSFDPAFAGESIPLLHEAVTYAKEHNIRLIIELKPNGHEWNFERSVVNVVTRANFADMCVIASQKYSVLQRVKEYDSSIRTMYITGFAYGDVNKLGDADYFSMESSNITPIMVSRVHNAGKPIFAWTVNTEPRIEKMIALGVDNVITDNVPLAKKCVLASQTSSMLRDYLQALWGR